MDDTGAPTGGTVGALMAAMDLLENLPPAGPAVRERGYRTEADLVDGLADPDATVRRGCLELLAEPRSAVAAPQVIERLGDPEWEVRYYAAHALTRAGAGVGDDGVVSAAIDTARSDSSRYVRMLAVEIVAGAADHDRDAADALAAVRDADADPGVRRKAARYAPRAEPPHPSP